MQGRGRVGAQGPHRQRSDPTRTTWDVRPGTQSSQDRVPKRDASQEKSLTLPVLSSSVTRPEAPPAARNAPHGLKDRAEIGSPTSVPSCGPTFCGKGREIVSLQAQLQGAKLLSSSEEGVHNSPWEESQKR